MEESEIPREETVSRALTLMRTVKARLSISQLNYDFSMWMRSRHDTYSQLNRKIRVLRTDLNEIFKVLSHGASLSVQTSLSSWTPASNIFTRSKSQNFPCLPNSPFRPLKTAQPKPLPIRLPSPQNSLLRIHNPGQAWPRTMRCPLPLQGRNNCSLFKLQCILLDNGT